mmetsp:Transcript_91416/g.191097  ORF Transcript_91416/g.191097 Transcript_91416/m.191097 type:complete len:259 (+) Transcript_91416:137-913(+)|eukprot:CAMPEP_0206490334 /NCGR_PEP_ID=MMETSP0324_2-20121206/43976_1 /ASSEMBLY_ACC=CAM_ASM_000836 /TAXON_ID=2866 /ORGANISM="Crypthecodinium cohnii, Strain Seligo" /LENGTH=258 /DNA_ID=CAMNT_0053970589 /DNA_START=123 /DNA_END=899 /DNA_ORIENTATION=-
MFLTCCCVEDAEAPTLLHVGNSFDPSPELESLARIEKAADRSAEKAVTLPTVPEASVEGVISVTIKVPHKAGVGLALDFAEGPHLRICGIVPNGPVAKHNSTAHADLQVHPGDFLVQAKRCADAEGPAASSSTAGTKEPGAVGQDSVAAGIVALVQMGGQLELLIRRPFTYKVQGIARGSKGLGLDLSYHAQGTAVAVLAILDGGAIFDYNKTVGASSPGAVQVGDYILEANGESGRIDPLLQGLGAETVNLVMARPK